MKELVRIGRGNNGRVKISFPYNPAYIAKIKAIEGYRWQVIKYFHQLANKIQSVGVIRSITIEKK